MVAFLYYRFCYDSFKKLLHRQKLARMVLENKWYEADTIQDSGFFTDLQSRSREKIVWFPKIYYQMEKGLLHIRCEITLGKYQDQLLRLEDKLESGLYCELTDKTLHDGYIEYILLYDMIANRITIDEVRAENGCLRLMKNLVWEYDELPHALIAGGTGGGKTYFLLTLIEALLHTNAVLYILDPKNADLADLGTVMGNVYHTKEEMIDCVNAFYEGMVQRSEEMKRHPNYKTGENYAYLGLPPCFLIFDEYVAFFEMLGTKESVSLLSQLKKIVMLGRQAGYFLIVACQRPDAKYFSDGIRDNFNFRVGLGRISELGYGMLFGSDVKKQFFQKRIKGRGYCDVGTSVISEFYTPLVPKGHDFLQTIGRLAQERQVIDSFTDYDFAHLLFSDGTVENAISLDNQLNIIQVADLVLPDKDTTFEEYTTIELLSVSMLIVISTFALDFIHSDRSIFKIVDLDEAWAFLNVAQGETLSNKLVRAGRAMQAGVYFVTQSSGDVSKESLKNNIGLKFAFRSTDINEIKQTLEFFGIDKDDENNQKRLRDLENGQCLLQDLYGRVGVVQIHPVFEELLHAFDTRPPVQRNEVK